MLTHLSSSENILAHIIFILDIKIYLSIVVWSYLLVKMCMKLYSLKDVSRNIGLLVERIPEADCVQNPTKVRKRLQTIIALTVLNIHLQSLTHPLQCLPD